MQKENPLYDLLKFFLRNLRKGKYRSGHDIERKAVLRHRENMSTERSTEPPPIAVSSRFRDCSYAASVASVSAELELVEGLGEKRSTISQERKRINTELRVTNHPARQCPPNMPIRWFPSTQHVRVRLRRASASTSRLSHRPRRREMAHLPLD